MLSAALRSLVRQPSFTLAAIGTLALGIGASTALFSTVRAVLLEPLPYSRPQDLYTVRTFFPSGRFTIGLMGSEEMSALGRLDDAVAATAMVARSDAALETDLGGRQVTAFLVSGGFFDLFGVPMARGRAISPADAVRGAAPVAVLSHALWRTIYGGREDMIGRAVALGNRQVRIVGIAPPAFDVPAGTDVWLNAWIPDSVGHAFEGYVRLKPGVASAALSGRMQQLMDGLGRKYPDQEVGRAYALRPLLAATVGDLGPILWILFGATALLLLLAAANVSNLLLVRSTGRSREFAIRAALGAGRARLATLLMTESALLSAAGGVVGILAAYGAVRVLVHYGAARLPRVATLTFDARVMGFALAVSAMTTLVVTIVPALRMTDIDIAQLMNETGRSVRGSRRTRRALAAFVVAEIAVAVALVAAGGRLLESYARLAHIDPGFDPRGRVVLDVVAPPSPAPERRNVWWTMASERLRQAGASRLASASSLPLRPERDSTTFVDLVSRPDIPPEKRLNARRRLVSPDFFAVMGMPVLAGRTFTAADDPSAPGVAIVNETFVRRSLGDADPLRERMKGLLFRRVNGKFVEQEVAIVGVVGDAHYASVTEPPEPIVYLPRTQFQSERELFVIMTADGTPERHIAEFRAAIRDFDPKLAIEFGTMSGFVTASLERPRLGMWLMTAFGIAGLVLATVGVFGVVAYVVSQRRGELAVRQALGASRIGVVWMVVRDGAGALAAGVAGGLLIALRMGGLVGRYVYGVKVLDVTVLGGSIAVVAAVVVVATVLPASRATQLDLARRLRQD